MYLCPKCRLFKAKSFLKVINHLRLHESKPGFSVECGVQGCGRSYGRVESLKKHIYRQHRDLLDLDQKNNSRTDLEDVWQCDEAVEDDEWGDIDDCCVEESAMTDKVFERAKALFILKIREERRLTQVSYTVSMGNGRRLLLLPQGECEVLSSQEEGC